MDYRIVKFIPTYKNQILTLWEKSVLATHHFLDPVDFETFKGMLQDFDFDTLDTFCLLQNEKIIGFIALHDKKIEMLFLDPAYINKGLGYQLINYAFKNFQANLVDVNEQNISAKLFYENMGFETYERTDKDDSGKNYPLLRMRLKTK